jgi:hypothetical protein
MMAIAEDIGIVVLGSSLLPHGLVRHRPPPRGYATCKKALDPAVGAAGKPEAAAKWPNEMEGAKNMTTDLTGVVVDLIAAVNAFDTDAIVANFVEDSYVNDNRREITGVDAIRRSFAKEFVGDHVTMEVRDVVDKSRRRFRRVGPDQKHPLNWWAVRVSISPPWD